MNILTTISFFVHGCQKWHAERANEWALSTHRQQKKLEHFFIFCHLFAFNTNANFFFFVLLRFYLPSSFVVVGFIYYRGRFVTNNRCYCPHRDIFLSLLIQRHLLLDMIEHEHHRLDCVRAIVCNFNYTSLTFAIGFPLFNSSNE